MRPTLLLCLAALLPAPALAQAWTTIQATPPSPAGYQVAKTREDIRDGRRSGQLTTAEARALRRENERVGALAAGSGTTDAGRVFAQGAAEAIHGLVIAKRSQPKP